MIVKIGEGKPPEAFCAFLMCLKHVDYAQEGIDADVTFHNVRRQLGQEPGTAYLVAISTILQPFES